MKKLFTFTLVLLSGALLKTTAQTSATKGYEKGSVTLADNSIVYGVIKDDIRKNASVTIMNADGSDKRKYDGDKLNAVMIDTIRFICIKGDFFKLICEGELCFLQKLSDASGKPVYVGNEAMFINGTPGKPGDYFLHNISSKNLQHITNKNVTMLTAQSFVNCQAAIIKVKEATGNIAMLKDAVIIYNNRNKQ